MVVGEQTKEGERLKIIHGILDVIKWQDLKDTENRPSSSDRSLITELLIIPKASSTSIHSSYKRSVFLQ